MEAVTQLVQSLIISTHAPAGGATLHAPDGRGICAVFLLTPLREGRRISTADTSYSFLFLLTPLREGRPAVLLLAGRAVERISTHAPAGGATPHTRSQLQRPAYFYSRPCGRGDPPGFLRVVTSVLFLLTPLREGRPSPTSQRRRKNYYFYSRPCGRGDETTLKRDC